VLRRSQGIRDQEIRVHISEMATLKFTYFFKQYNNTFLIKSRKLFNRLYMFFVLPLEYTFKKHPITTKWAITILIKVKLRTALLIMPLLCIRSCLEWVLIIICFPSLFSNYWTCGF
jgi:hypothetical protein